MRLTALLAGLALAGAASAAEAPTRVDLILFGSTVDEDYVLIQPDEGDGWIALHPPMIIDTTVAVEKVHRGKAPGKHVQVVSYVRNSSILRHRLPALYWLKRRADGRFDEVCAVTPGEWVTLQPGPDPAARIPKDWRHRTPCDP